jgi:hypothetical protein
MTQERSMMIMSVASLAMIAATFCPKNKYTVTVTVTVSYAFYAVHAWSTVDLFFEIGGPR